MLEVSVVVVNLTEIVLEVVNLSALVVQILKVVVSVENPFDLFGNIGMFFPLYLCNMIYEYI